MSNEDFSLGQQIAELRGLVVAKFDSTEKSLAGINNHLATLNGKVAAHEKQLTDDSGVQKGIVMTWKRIFGLIAAGGTIMGLVVAIINIISRNK